LNLERNNDNVEIEEDDEGNMRIMSTLVFRHRYKESDTPKAEWSTKRSFGFVDTEADDIEEKED
jgi:hypothetical protein